MQSFFQLRNFELSQRKAGGTVEGCGVWGGVVFVDQKAICVWITKDRKECLKITSLQGRLHACIGRSTNAYSTLHTQIIDLQMKDHEKCTQEM